MSFTSPLLGSSPPTKSPSLPIKRGGLSRSFAAAQTVVKPDGSERRSSETGQQRQQSISYSKTPFASFASTSTVSGSQTAAKPPVPAVQRPSLRVEGFSAPESTNVALSPGKLRTKSSLLTASLLEPTLSSELFGAVQPQHQFQVGSGLQETPSSVFHQS